MSYEAGIYNKRTGSRTLSARKRLHILVAGPMIACVASAPASAAPTATPSARTAPDTLSPGTRVFAEQAGKLGAQKCARLYSVLGDLVSQGANYAVRTETNKQAPDAHPIQGAVGMTYNLPDLKGQAAGLVFAAPVANGCEGHFVRIAPFQKPCEQVVKDLPAGSVGAANLSGVPVYQLGGGQGQALMIPSGASCVVVTVTPGSQAL
ncbi:hypothetical protein [Sphingopyxis sp.]|uniref:hypothetical protein n=1 Tax=Sphingopyxis sp. TaxID=1908224 RepID=UPI002B49B71E|nr:hypothetical protein [Sphingopyxis sp.]HJS09987.1 hypothetical protein [Sphingopyxis sp.]